MASATLEQARAAKSTAAALFADLADVLGVGITRIGDGYVIKVKLRAAPERTESLPSKVGGVPLRVEVVGLVRKCA